MHHNIDNGRMLSSDTNNIRQAVNIALLVLSAATVPAFVWWMDYQVKRSRPALIPNSLWRNVTFTSACVTILFTSAVSNSMELFSSLLYVFKLSCAELKPLLTPLSFQQVQGNSALGASLRILPALVTAVTTNVSTGYFVNRMPVMWVVLASSALSAISPLLMAVINPQWPYWYMAFIAQVGSSARTASCRPVLLLISHHPTHSLSAVTLRCLTDATLRRSSSL